MWPPTTSQKPSPPSDTGIWSQLQPAAVAARATAAATSPALAVPRNLSGAATRWGTIQHPAAGGRLHAPEPAGGRLHPPEPAGGRLRRHPAAAGTRRPAL